MKQSDYMKQMEARSLVMREIELNCVAINSIKMRVDVIDITDNEYNKAMTKKRFLEEHNAELSHKKRMIEADIDARTRTSLELDDQPSDHPDLFKEEDAASRPNT